MTTKNVLHPSLVFLFTLSLISCQKENQPPVAGFTFTPATGTVDTVFTFDASDSYDNEDEGSTIQVRWDWTNDGSWDTDFSSNKVMTHQFTEPGEFTIVLEAKDTKGLVNSISKKVTVIEGDAGSLRDSRDGQQYSWVKIGTQKWMAENLAYLPAVSPSNTGSETGKHCYVYGYEGTSVSTAKSYENYTTYGVLYNWPAAMNGAPGSNSVPSGVQGICPDGWHLPSDAEWTILTDFLGNSAGKKMKSTFGWSSNGNGDNSSGFSAVPGGARGQNGGFGTLGDIALFWSSTENGSSYAWYRGLNYSSDVVHRYGYDRRYGFSVRCLKN